MANDYNHSKVQIVLYILYSWTLSLPRRIYPRRWRKTPRVNPVKYGIITLSFNNDLYNGFDDYKRRYYKMAGVPNRFAFSEPAERPKASEDIIHLTNCIESTPTLLERFLFALRELENDQEWRSCDYIIRANASTFVNLEMLDRYLRILPRKKCYAGFISFHRYAMGTCIVFSRDVADRLARLDPGPERFRSDDVLLRDYMLSWGVPMRPLPMRFFLDDRIQSEEEIAKALSEYPLLRIKSRGNRELYDMDIWKKIALIKRIP